MLAYRHAFHAGNHGDVLKHVVLVAVLRHLNLKDKGWRLVDTHAGAGAYSLTGASARKLAEHADGIGRLWQRTDLPPEVADYVGLVKGFNAKGRLSRYPGSPALALALKRPQDQLRLFDLHPTDFRALSSFARGQAGVEARPADGFEALKAQLPPPTRRGVVLIDPSYEGERDYARVVTALRDALTRFAQGTYIVWYPQVGKVQAAELPRRLKALGAADWLHARLTVARADARGFGRAGSGVFVVNPPHTLRAGLERALPWLHAALQQAEGGGVLLEGHSP